jgi:hypothetical protein
LLARKENADPEGAAFSFCVRPDPVRFARRRCYGAATNQTPPTPKSGRRREQTPRDSLITNQWSRRRDAADQR